MARPKDIGTAFETAVTKAARSFGLVARRLAEGGVHDEGDVEIHDAYGRRYVIECKARANGNAHHWLAAAQRKTRDAVVAVAWKRLERKDGNLRRTAAGPPMVCLSLTDFLALLPSDPYADEEAA